MKTTIRKILGNSLFVFFLLCITGQDLLADSDDYMGRVHSFYRTVWIYSNPDKDRILAPTIKNSRKVCYYVLARGSAVSLKNETIFKNKNNRNIVKINLRDDTILQEMCGEKGLLFHVERTVNSSQLNGTEIYADVQSTNFLVKDGVATTKKLYTKKINSELNLAKDKISDLSQFIEKYSDNKYATSCIKDARKRIDVLHKEEIAVLFKKCKEEPGIKSLEEFVREYPEASERQAAITEIYNRVIAENKFDTLVKTADTYQDSNKRATAIAAIYRFVNKQNTIEGYRWFAAKYSKSKESHQAMNHMYLIAFSITENIGTLEAYNDFIIGYPYAPQIKETTKKAYSLEEEKYSKWFSSDEKNSRALLIQSKRISRKMNELEDASAGKGYILVIDRMNELLQDKFPAEDATLRYLESEEFKDFIKEFKTAMKDIKSALADINDSAVNLSSVIQNQSQMMDTHFKDNAYSQKMADEYTKQYQDWERYLKPYGVM